MLTSKYRKLSPWGDAFMPGEGSLRSLSLSYNTKNNLVQANQGTVSKPSISALTSFLKINFFLFLVMAEIDLTYESLPAESSSRTHMLAGAFAGISEHCLIFPIDSIKVSK